MKLTQTLILVPMLGYLWFSPALSHEQAQTNSCDLVIAGGRVIDPESNLDAVRHIGVKGGIIVAISAKPLQGKEVVDATGLVVSSGFIDLHSHAQTLNDRAGFSCTT